MSVTLDEIIQVVLLESGQFIADLPATLLDKQKFKVLVARELGIYSRYMPNKTTTIGVLFDGKVFDQFVDGFVPTSIVDIRYDAAGNGSIHPYLPTFGPIHSYHWQYRNPVLKFRYPQGVYEYTYIGPHQIGQNDTYPTINLHDKVINLIIGRFLMTVGRSRRAFTVDEIPINTDADTMVSEGKELYEKTDKR